MEAYIESGIQLLARLSGKPSLVGLDDTLFPDGPVKKETVEISGNVSVGKTFLLTQLLAKCILPKTYENLPLGGLNASAILINTDCHFQASKLVDLMLTQIKNACVESNESLDDGTMMSIVHSCMDNLYIFNCYDNQQFLITLHSLDNILLRYKNVSLLAIDSILSYYWQNREIVGIQSMEFYTKSLLQIIHKHTFPINITTIYTRPTNKFQVKSKEKCVNTPITGRLNYKIELNKINPSEFFATIISSKGEKRVKYKIDKNGLRWRNVDQ